MSREVGVNGNKCETLDKHFEYTIKHRKTIENEHDSQFKDYRDNNQDEKNIYLG